MLTSLRPVLLLAAFLAVMPAHAQEEEAPRPRTERESAADRVRQVERDGGRVLQAEPMQRGGREVYRLKVLTPEGRVRVLHDSRGREPRPERTQRLDSARQSPMLRGRNSQDRSAPPPPAAERPMPRRDEGGRGGRNDRD
ncbi:hypothetical protein [Arenimonas sp. MALMAid1274]|uniref:hypothetical protein n=1 Tax=Arenimonas sp. MALMAid1274 TaxID=3411630 RepID=UPI003BA15FCC